MTNFRSVTPFVVITALLLGFGQGDAFAKKEKAPKETKETTEMVEIVMTGIAEADSKVFEPAKAIHDTLAGIENSLKTGTDAFTSALGVTQGTPFADALASLKANAGDSLSVAMDGVKPKITVADAAPDNVKAAVSSLNDLVNAHVAAMDQAKDLPAQAQALVAAAQTLDPAAMAKQAAANPMDVPKVLKTINNNLKTVKTTPDRVKNVTGTLTGNVEAIKGLAG